MAKPLKYKKDGKTFYRVNFRWRGKTFRKQGFLNGQQAQNYINSTRAIPELEDQTGDLPELIDRYLHWAEITRQKTWETIDKDRRRLDIFLNRWAIPAGIRSIAELTLPQMREFQAFFMANHPFYGKPNHRKTGDGRATWNKYQEILSAFFNWCIDQGYIDRNPIARKEFRYKIQRSAPMILKADQLEKLLAWFDEYDKTGRVPVGAYFRLILFTGLRPGEATHLRWQDVSLTKKLITVTQGSSRGETKTRTIRQIPIHSRLLPVLKSLPTRDLEYVFDGGDNRPIYKQNRFLQILYQACRETGVVRHRVYDWRHSAAGYLYMSGIDLPTIQKILGHSDIRMTMKYGDIFLSHISESMERLKIPLPE